MLPRRILCPVDFSKTSRHAMRWAMALAERLGAEVTLLHVYTLPQPVLPDGTTLLATPETISQLTDAAERELKALEKEALEAAPGVRVSPQLVEGDAAREILRACENNAVDLVVMGTEGRGAVGRFFVGSCADKVMRRAPVPVTTIRLDAAT